MFYVILCDDDIYFMSHMKKLLNAALLGKESVVFIEYSSGEEMLCSFDEKTECDLLILDMQMPGLDGDETAKLFRRRFPDAILVFCSGEVFPTTKSFESEPYRYLMKSSSDEEMVDKLRTIMSKVAYEKAHSYVTIEDKNGKHTLKVIDIAYVEIIERGCEINFKKDKDGERVKLKVNKKMSDMKKLLSEFRFVSPHKSFLVNFEHIITVRNTELELKDGTILAISKHKLKEFRQEYLKCAIKP